MRRPFVFVLLSFVLATAPALAQQAPATTDTASGGSSTDTASAGADGDAQSAQQIEDLRRRLDVLAAEVERLRSGEPEQREVTEAQQRALGVAPSAAATYRRSTEGVSFAGYGEMLLQSLADEDESGVAGGGRTELDFLRAVVYAGYRFSDRFLFNSEIEFEHGGEEVGVEFAYLDYMVNQNLSIRGGMLLLPLGLVNEFHEPTVFIGARRPLTEQRILPSTWHENGGGVLGTFGVVNFRAYLVNGFDASGFSSSGLRGGRQGGVEAAARDWGFAGRLDVTPIPGVFGGVGLYRGGSGQGEIENAGETLDVTTTIAEVHAQAQIRGFDLRGLFAHASIDDAAGLNAALGSSLTSPVAEAMQGGYVQFGYNVLSQINTPLSLLPFVRVERVDTQHEIPAGYLRDLAADVTVRTFGVEFKPLPNIVLKTDYQWVGNEADTGRNQFNFNLGYAF